MMRSTMLLRSIAIEWANDLFECDRSTMLLPSLRLTSNHSAILSGGITLDASLSTLLLSLSRLAMQRDRLECDRLAFKLTPFTAYLLLDRSVPATPPALCLA